MAASLKRPYLSRALNGTVALIIVGLLSGCATGSREMYYWGNYEDLVYKMYKKPGEATPEVQIERLNRDLEQAQAKGLAVPPGVYAHLGIMYAALGMQDKAEQAFLEEKFRFPESAVLIDGMLTRAAGQ